MQTATTYQKVASYEAKQGEVKRTLLLYSGGLDTSVILTWIQEHYRAEVVALTFNIGQQHDDIEAIRQKALKFGAVKAIAVDARAEFADEYLAKGIKANASYQGDYHLSTPMGRALLSKKAVEIAKAEGCDSIAHGCTGTGNDPVRFEGSILTHDPAMQIMAPVREWMMDRNEEIRYAQAHHIPVPVRLDFPYSVDDNMWGMTWEGGEIEDPSLVAPVDKFLTRYTRPKNSENESTYVKLEFKNGLPCKLDGKAVPLAEIIIALNTIGGAQGVGVYHTIEDRLVGLKNRGIWEQPGASVIINGHQALERYVSTRELNELKSALD